MRPSIQNKQPDRVARVELQVCEHVDFMHDQQGIHGDQGIDQISDRNEAVNAKVEVHNEHDQCRSGNRHFDHGKGMHISLYQPVHQEIELDSSVAQQDDREKGIRETEQGDRQGCCKRPVTIPVDIPVNLVIIPAMDAAALKPDCTRQGPG